MEMVGAAAAGPSPKSEERTIPLRGPGLPDADGPHYAPVADPDRTPPVREQGTRSSGLQHSHAQGMATLPSHPGWGGGPPSLGLGGISMFPAWEAALMSAHLK